MGATAPRLKIILVVVAAAAALSVILASASAPAGAYSGGTSTTSGGGDKYQRLWDNVSRSNKRWASHTAKCESGKNPDAIGGGGLYRGAFQFMKSTWRHAPKSPGGDPIKYPYRTQAVVAVYLKKRDGTGHWPNCG